MTPRTSKQQIHALTGIAHTNHRPSLESTMSTSIARTAARIISGARDRYDHSNPSALDFRVATEGLERYGELYQETWAVANEGSERDDEPVCRARADVLWEQVLPELEQYAHGCRSAKYTGWSRESGRSVRRVR